MEFKNFAIGTDIEEIERFQEYGDKNSKLVTRVFSKNEIEYCYKNEKFAQHLAVRFCAKEACVKALCDLGFKNVLISDFEVKKREDGSVFIESEKYKALSFKLSISHSINYATATVVVFSN